MEKYALIVAGGSGTRMGSATPKQFLKLRNKPLLWHTIRAFQSAFSDIHIVLVVPESYQHENTLQDMALRKTELVTGGATRFHSVKNGLSRIPAQAVVFVHDGVRCLPSKALIERCYKQTLDKGNAIPVVKATDSMRIDKDDSHCIIDRTHIRLVQTPQTFISSELQAAFALPYQDSFTDEASVMEAAGRQVYLVEGEYENIKITRPLDLLIAEAILTQREQSNQD